MREDEGELLAIGPAAPVIGPSLRPRHDRPNVTDARTETTREDPPDSTAQRRVNERLEAVVYFCA
jgi:hypothetical protein